MQQHGLAVARRQPPQRRDQDDRVVGHGHVLLDRAPEAGQGLQPGARPAHLVDGQVVGDPAHPRLGKVVLADVPPARQRPQERLLDDLLGLRQAPRDHVDCPTRRP